MHMIKALIHKTAAYSVVVYSLLLIATWIQSSAGAQSPAQTHLQQAILANSLDSAGKVPFHIKIAFQLYDLAGNPSDSGSVEEWWSSSGVSRIMVKAASLKNADAGLLNDDLAIDPREKYLIHKLLQAAVHPIPALGPSSIGLAKEGSQKFDSITLTCFTIIGEQISGTGMGSSRYCIDPATYSLRMQFEGQMSTTARNGPATFHDTHVAMAMDIAYQNIQAISGKITVLQSFDPPKLEHVVPPSSAPKEDRTGIVPGRSLTHKSPDYPPIAKASHVAGAVLLHAIISKQGTTGAVFALAGKTPALTQAAIDAVESWTYVPFQLNGQPVDIETTITVNFNFGSTTRN